MVGVPRRLPPTQGERVRNIDRSHASLSARGRTASARPVPQSRPENQIYSAGGNVVTGATDGAGVSITSTKTGSGSSDAAADAIAIGPRSAAEFGNAAVVGADAYAAGDGAAAFGSGSDASHIYSTAVGANTIADGNGCGAFGCDSTGTGAGSHGSADNITIGTTMHSVAVDGVFVIRDDVGQPWRLVISGGALSVAPYTFT